MTPVPRKMRGAGKNRLRAVRPRFLAIRAGRTRLAKAYTTPETLNGETDDDAEPDGQQAVPQPDAQLGDVGHVGFERGQHHRAAFEIEHQAGQHRQARNTHTSWRWAPMMVLDSSRLISSNSPRPPAAASPCRWRSDPETTRTGRCGPPDSHPAGRRGYRNPALRPKPDRRRPAWVILS